MGRSRPRRRSRREGEAWFRVGGRLEKAADPLLRPRAARAGNRLDGPAIVNQYDSTTVVPPGVAAHVDRVGNIVIEVGLSAEAETLAAPIRAAAR